jgi:D-alanyl-D-alanine carboxypeptidase/D-alanyl-D-alanine-endopeptidase (penicillin-binding protein 4)
MDGDSLPAKPDLTAAHVLASRQSPPLSALTASMMKVSQNQYAEMFLKALGAIAAPMPGARPGSVAAGRLQLRDIFRSWTIEDDSYIVADGSGLSRYNYVTADTIVRLLQLMHDTTADREPFEASLPVAGKDGTLSRRLIGTVAEGRVRAKTGSIDNVRAISGYVESAGGETLEFSVIANNFSGPASAIDALADAALVRLASFDRSLTRSRSAAVGVPAAVR